MAVGLGVARRGRRQRAGGGWAGASSGQVWWQRGGLRAGEDVLLHADLRAYLQAQYAHAGLTDAEIDRVIRDLERLPASDLYESNKAVMKLLRELASFDALGIDFEEKAFSDILKMLTRKYDFAYPEDKLLHLAREVKHVVADKAKYTDWSRRDDIKAELKADLIVLLAENDYPPVDRDEGYREIFARAEGFRRGR